MELCALAWETGELVERREKKGERGGRGGGEKKKRAGEKKKREGGEGGKRESKAQAVQAAGRVVRGKRGSKL